MTGHLRWPVLSEFREAQAEIDAFYEEVFGNASTKQEAPNRDEPTRTEEEVEHLCRTRQGQQFTKLFDEGVWDGGKESADKSASAGDLALCGIIARYTDDAGMIDRMFRRSRMMRGKWDEPRSEGTYGSMTIAKALASKKRAYEPPEGRIKLIQAAELMEMPLPQVSYVWDDVLVCGGTSLIGGKVRVGKSTLMANIAIAVARGEPFLERACHRTTVIYLALGSEAKPEAMKEIMQLRGMTKVEPLYLYIDIAPANLMNQLKWIVDDYEDPLIIMDTLHKATGIRDVNDYDEVGDKLGPFTNFARTIGRGHLCFIHHAKKGETFDIDSVLGSARLTAESIIYCSTGRGLRTTYGS
jgi:hypothetical protein